jgi:thioredoxin reductase (NADPH)
MVTAEEIAAVPLFASLGAAELERLSRAAADLRPDAGEYVVNQGDERALFAVLEGLVQVVLITDGVERLRGLRRPGEIFGEVPITLGTVFPVGFRAVEPSRVMRIEPPAYHAVAAVAPDLGKEVGRLALERIGGGGGLQMLVADAPPPRATVLGRRLDAAGAELRQFLDRNRISFAEVVADSPDAVHEWGGPLPPEEDWPVIRVVDGTTVARPELRTVAGLVGLTTEPSEAGYDTVVVGGGPAGLAAAVYGASEGLGTLVVEREAPGGQAGTSSMIENYLGFHSGISGDELAKRALDQARRLGAEILVTRTVEQIEPDRGGVHLLHLDGGDVVRARSIVLASGVSWRRLAIEGCAGLVGKGVFYGAARSEAPNTHGLDVHIIGAGNSAGQAARFFAAHANTVTILYRGDDLAKSMSRYLIDQLAKLPNVVVEYRAEVVGAHGEGALEAIDVRNAETGETTRRESGGLFILIGADAQTGWLPGEIALEDKGYVLTGPDLAAAGRWETGERDPYLLETSVPGIFAVGDVRFGSVKRCAAAVGEGSMAIAFVHQHFRHEEARPSSVASG